MISFACAFSTLFSEHIRVVASDYHSSLSIISDIFRKRPSPSTLICSPWLRL